MKKFGLFVLIFSLIAISLIIVKGIVPLSVADNLPQSTEKSNLSNVSSYSYYYVSQFGTRGSGDCQFEGPMGIAVDPSGYIYVSDWWNSNIQKFDSNGKFITKWGGGGPKSPIQTPQGIAFDSSGNLYIAETWKNRIRKVNSNGESLGFLGNKEAISLGVKLIGHGQFKAPWGIAIDHSGNIYITDTGHNIVQKFNSEGVFITQWGTKGINDGQFNSLSFVAADSAGNIYVADSLNNRIQKFSSDGAFITKWESSGKANGQFNQPEGIAVDKSNNVYVVDKKNNRVQVFNSNGTFINKFGTGGSGPGQFGYPNGIAVDASGNIFISDYGNYRVQIFKYGIPPMGSPNLPVKDINNFPMKMPGMKIPGPKPGINQ